MVKSSFNKLHADLLAALTGLRTRFADAGIPSFRIAIELFCDHGELEIKYNASKRWESGATGNSLGAVVDETIRRYGWDTANNMKLLESRDG